jgi:hypothetical protein
MVSSAMLVWILLIVLILVVVYIYVKCNTGPVVGGFAGREIIVYTDSDAKSLKKAVRHHKVIYNPDELASYSNVPTIWVGSTASRAADFMQANPGVASALILWYPTSKPANIQNEYADYTFVVLDNGKYSQDNEWAKYSNHRYYISNKNQSNTIADILSMIR